MSINSRVIAGLAAVLLAGCAASAAPMQRNPVPALSPSDRRALQGVLAQYDRQIAALRLTLNTPAFGNSTRDVDADIAALREVVSASSNAVQTLIARKAGAYAAREDNAVSAVLAAASASAPSTADVQQRLETDYRAEYARLRAGAQSDMKDYQSALFSEQQHAYGTFVRSIQNRTTQAYAHRDAELREKESALMLELARRDAPQRLQLRAKLTTLALNSSENAAIRAQLGAIQAREDRVLAQQQASDARVLGAYRDRLLAKADSDVAAMSAQLQARTQANLAQRRDVLTAQRNAPSNLALGRAGAAASPANPDLRARVAAMRSAGAQAFQNDAAATVAAYTSAGDDLSGRFSAVRDHDRSSAQSTLAAIAQLRRDRAALAARLSL